MKTTGKYVFDSSNIEEKCFDLLAVFFSNKEFSRRIHPLDNTSAISLLNSRYFESKMSRLLIEIAAALRILDDQMKKLPKDDNARTEYLKRLIQINNFPFALFDENSLTLRDVCNKIIHSEIFDFFLKDGTEPHEDDLAFLAGFGERDIQWRYASDYVRLSGTYRGKTWHVILTLEIFVSAIYELFRR